MKFLLLVVALAGVSQSLKSGEKNIEFTENGFVITDASGKQITINKQIGPFGPKSIDVTVSGPSIPTKRIHLDDKQKEVTINDVNVNDLNNVDYADEQTRTKRSKSEKSKYPLKTQTDVLGEILKNFEGVNDDVTYEKLLSKINKAVQKGELNPSIYEILKQFQGDFVAQQQYQGQREVVQGQQGLTQVQKPFYGEQYYKTYPYKSQQYPNYQQFDGYNSYPTQYQAYRSQYQQYPFYPYYQKIEGYNSYPTQYQGYGQVGPQRYFPGFWRDYQYQPQQYGGYQQEKYYQNQYPFYQGYEELAY
ncbi:unnamed protein product [Brassicogethes aeneus]|uniref:Uncharacterized protein n=1 Tax=Brassicogethes aeneus TaxID=1431903 RepID=A0A9P0FFN5_BRAAE|nr:unnamed protein product [Brassicogethes aeneus]